MAQEGQEGQEGIAPQDGESESDPWTVSLITLSRREPAEALARRVRDEGWSVDVREVGRRGGLWQVISGEFVEREAADAHAEAVAGALGLDGVWVTRRLDP
jgi:cell division septation protein DedD